MSFSELLLQAAPGEFSDCVNDVKKIYPSVTEEEIGRVTAQYYAENYETLTVEGKKFLITPHSTVSEGRFIAPSEKVLFSYDFTKGEANNVRDIGALDEDTETVRAALAAELAKYAKDHYSNGESEVYAVDVDGSAVLETEDEPVDEEEEGEPVNEIEVEKEGEIEEAEKGAEEEPAANETTEAAEATEIETEEPSKANATDDESETAEVPVPKDTTEEGESSEDGEAPAQRDEVKEGFSEEEPVEAKDEPSSAPEEPSSGPEEQPSENQETPLEEPQEKPTPLVPNISSRFALYLVGYKYNPRSFWTSRWKSSYILDTETKTLTGTIALRIHYFESGNVQLSTSFEKEFTLDSTAPGDIVQLIKKADDDAQKHITISYDSLSSDTFKSLRRALPKTRQKMDWNQIRSVNVTSTKLSSTRT